MEFPQRQNKSPVNRSMKKIESPHRDYNIVRVFDILILMIHVAFRYPSRHRDI